MPFINAVSVVSVFPCSVWADNRSLPSLSGTVRRDLCSPAQQSWRGVEGTRTAEIYTLKCRLARGVLGDRGGGIGR
jgi:hypothetical protein